MQDQRSLFAALAGDGRPLLAVTALSLGFAGAFALFLTATQQFLPHDVHYLQMSEAELCAFAGCRINAFMFHDRAAFGGSLIAVSVLYLWLMEFPLRSGEAWAWWTLSITGSLGFLSFLAYLGYGYLDTWHGAGTLALVPLFIAGLVRTRSWVGSTATAPPVRPSRRLLTDPSAAGRALLLATALGMVLGGAAILAIGMTSVFVADDLAFITLPAERVAELNPRLIPLIAHDRAGFGGGLLSTGLIVGSCVWFASMTRSLRQALWLAGAAGFGCAIGIHLVVGYTTWTHLAPAVAGAGMFLSGMVLSRPRAPATAGASPAHAQPRAVPGHRSR